MAEVENEGGGGSGPPVGAEDVGKEGGGGTLHPCSHLTTQVLPTWLGSLARGQPSWAGQPQLSPSAAWTQGQGGVGRAPPGVSWPGTFPGVASTACCDGVHV